ncbi:MAG: hypothetical protein AB1646_24140 [Thermodesulfobacteriota bacterium]
MMEQRNYTRMSVAGIVLGLHIQIVGLFVAMRVDHPVAGLCVLLAGTALLVWGCRHEATRRGYHGAWGLLGIANMLGLMVLLLFPEKTSFTDKSSPLGQGEMMEQRHYGRSAQAGIYFGLFLQFGLSIATWDQHPDPVAGLPYFGFGYGLFIWGCCNEARRRGYHAAWGLLGIASVLGLAVLLCFPDKSPSTDKASPLGEAPASKSEESSLTERSSPRGEGASSEVKKSRGWGCGLWVVAGVVIVFMWLSANMGYYYSGKRRGCDQQVRAELSKLSQAFANLAEEARALNIPWDEKTIEAIASGDGLQYMVGPHYGWSGCSDDCGIVFRMSRDRDGWVIEATSDKGSPGKGNLPTSRRKTVFDGRDLPEEVMKGLIGAHDGRSQKWNTYPRKDKAGRARCYGGSILRNRGTAARPLPGIVEPKSAECPPCTASSFRSGIEWLLGH